MSQLLIVEDDPQLRAMLKESMEVEGFEVLQAADGKEALKVYSADIEVVITDIHMPGKEGLGLITDLKKRNPDVNIIAISGGAVGLQPGCNLELAKQFGARATFAKPLDMDVLINTVRNLGRAEDQTS